ncbi:MAG: hypothetical protein EKK51_00165 [Mycolicibacterium sp.]|uniref:hypothetical protein n=1 Tax=Mycolicibacterium sp. TaxID=2320850 RepID=UPI000FA63DEB|nr:hypothetical protein [Mycolicibacterium sp.]RUP35007.1 MAG: hypothetical protein EKK51_00165 [Mycolicibacterium sp.]
MSKPPEVLPPPPEGLELSAVPNLTMADAAAWCGSALGIPVKVRYLQDNASSGALRVSLIGGKRFVSTSELWRFVCTRPARKADVRAARCSA